MVTLSTSSTITRSAIVRPPLRTSRTVVIGLGSFGLQVVALLLPRLEVYYHLVASRAEERSGEKNTLPAIEGPHAAKLLTRCGLLTRSANTLDYLILDRSVEAFTRVREIQRAILLQEHGSATSLATELQKLLAIDRGKWQSGLDEKEWLESLIRPILADAWDYTNPFVHLNVYLIASGQENYVDDIYALAQKLADFRVPMTVNLLMNMGALGNQLAQQDAQNSLAALMGDTRRASLLQQIYLVDHSKANQAVTESPGEAAMIVCNFLDSLVFSALGDKIAENTLPDSDYLLYYAPVSAIGAAKLYVPIAEVSAELLDEFVADRIRERLRPSRSNTEIKAQQQRSDGEVDLIRLCQRGLGGLVGLQMVPRQTGWQRFWDRIMSRFRGHEKNDELLKRRQLILQLPRLQVSRRYWRDTLQARGRRPTADVWWETLQEFRRDVLAQLPTWLDTAATRLGMAIKDEQMVSDLAQALHASEPFAQALQNSSMQERANKLQEWIEQHANGGPVYDPDLEKEILSDLFNHPTINAPLKAVPNWLGHRWWHMPPKKSGYLPTLDQTLREELAKWVADDTTGLKLAVARLKGMEERFRKAQQVLQAWQSEAQWTIRSASIKKDEQALKKAKKELIDALKARPYPSALIGRLLVLWLLPLFLALHGLITERLTLPTEWNEQRLTLIVGWTLAFVLIYLLRMGMANLRIWRVQRRIERVVLESLDQAIEQEVYGSVQITAADGTSQQTSNATNSTLTQVQSGPHRPRLHKQIGLLASYLQAFERLFVAPSQEDMGLPSSLLATFQETLDAFESDRTSNMTTAPECLVYRSIGHEMTRSLLETYLQNEWDDIPNVWELSEPAGLFFLYFFGYLLVVGVFAWVADQQRWSSRELRWVIQTSSRRGLRIAGVPLLDLGLLLGNLLLILAMARYAPFTYQLLLFLVIPLLIALSISLLSSHLLHPLDDFIAEPMTRQDYADQHKITYQALAQENGFDANDPDLMLRFGQQIKLPPR